MPSPYYAVDPITGDTTLTNPDGSIVQSSAADAFGMDVTVDNGIIRDPTTGRIVGNLGLEGPTTVVPLEGGGLSIGTSVPSALANGPLTGRFLGRSVDVQRMVSGTFGVIDTAGNEHLITVGDASKNDFGAYLAPFGKQRIAYVDTDGITRYEAARGPFRNTSDVQSVPGLEAYRLATAQESAVNSLRYWLWANAHEVLDRIAANGGINGVNGTDNFSGLLNYMAQVPALDQLNFVNNYFLPAAEGA